MWRTPQEVHAGFTSQHPRQRTSPRRIPGVRPQTWARTPASQLQQQQRQSRRDVSCSCTWMRKMRCPVGHLHPWLRAALTRGSLSQLPSQQTQRRRTRSVQRQTSARKPASMQQPLRAYQRLLRETARRRRWWRAVLRPTLKGLLGGMFPASPPRRIPSVQRQTQVRKSVLPTPQQLQQPRLRTCQRRCSLRKRQGRQQDRRRWRQLLRWSPRVCLLLARKSFHQGLLLHPMLRHRSQSTWHRSQRTLRQSALAHASATAKRASRSSDARWRQSMWPSLCADASTSWMPSCVRLRSSSARRRGTSSGGCPHPARVHCSGRAWSGNRRAPSGSSRRRALRTASSGLRPPKTGLGCPQWPAGTRPPLRAPLRRAALTWRSHFEARPGRAQRRLLSVGPAWRAAVPCSGTVLRSARCSARLQAVQQTPIASRWDRSHSYQVLCLRLSRSPATRIGRLRLLRGWRAMLCPKSSMTRCVFPAAETCMRSPASCVVQRRL